MFPSYSCFRLGTPKGRDLLSPSGYHPFFPPSPKHMPGWHPAGTPQMSAGWIDGWMDGWMDRQDGWMDGWTDKMDG